MKTPLLKSLWLMLLGAALGLAPSWLRAGGGPEPNDSDWEAWVSDGYCTDVTGETVDADSQFYLNVDTGSEWGINGQSDGADDLGSWFDWESYNVWAGGSDSEVDFVTQDDRAPLTTHAGLGAGNFA